MSQENEQRFINFLIGLDFDLVIKLISAADYSYRVLKEDGCTFMGATNFISNRFNLEIEKGIVTKAYLG